ncbi:MAG: DUF4328 domain-containing protein [Acidobacteriota bacterium]|jgi:hypothetical protein
MYYCTSCGKLNVDGARYCYSCGSSIKVPDQAKSVPSPEGQEEPREDTRISPLVAENLEHGIADRFTAVTPESVPTARTESEIPPHRKDDLLAIDTPTQAQSSSVLESSPADSDAGAEAAVSPSMASEFRQEYRSLPTLKLVAIANSDTSEYRAAAIEAARAELTHRGENWQDEETVMQAENPVSEVDAGKFREMTSMTKLLKILLGVSAAMAIVRLFSACLQFLLLAGGTFSQAEGHANDSRQAVIALFGGTLYLVTAVVFGRWIYRANQNVRALGAQDMRFTPGWAVGYFFVPIITLWRPYQAMKDLWRASKSPGAWQSAKPGSILGLWWTLWIISNFLGLTSFRALMGAHDIVSFLSATIIQMVSDVVDIPLCIVALTLVSQIHQSQNAASTASSLQDTATAPGS